MTESNDTKTTKTLFSSLIAYFFAVQHSLPPIITPTFCMVGVAIVATSNPFLKTQARG